MKRLEYDVSFATPAFLGNAEQQAQWRTPPFKAMIRHWWRIVKAPLVNFDVEALRQAEGRLFGAAADDGDSRRSLVRFRLSGWSAVRVSTWDADDKIPHPEVTNGAGAPMSIGAQLYLGYGPLTFKSGKTSLNTDAGRSALAPGEDGLLLTLIVPESFEQEVREAIQLADWFGSIGSRSRNGWGSLQMVARPDTPPIPRLSVSLLSPYLRDLALCLQRDWPHAVGSCDGRPLVWLIPPQDSWRKLVRELASIKITFRTHPKTMSLVGVPKGKFAPRHLLAYPVTHHGVSGNHWGNQGRLANQIRFKAFKDANRWRGVIVHTPSRLPEEMLADLPAGVRGELSTVALAAWREVHGILDKLAQRIEPND